ncbi:MAG: hypothetical protein WDN48_17420 [Pseudolabrys sp.]
MLKFTVVTTIGALLLAGIVTQAAAAARVRGNNIAFSGCTEFRVPFCTVAVSGGKTYWLTDATPPIPANVGVTLVGVLAGDVNPCFATAVKVTKWKRNRLHCPMK